MVKKNNTVDAKSPVILIVEDSPTQAASLNLLLAQHGVQVLWAENGKDCLKFVDKVLPDLIIMDLEMPEMNGFQTCERLKQRSDTVDIPVIMLTHHDEAEFAKLGLQQGVVDYIPKDAFSNAVLLETLKQMNLVH